MGPTIAATRRLGNITALTMLEMGTGRRSPMAWGLALMTIIVFTVGVPISDRPAAACSCAVADPPVLADELRAADEISFAEIVERLDGAAHPDGGVDRPIYQMRTTGVVVGSPAVEFDLVYGTWCESPFVSFAIGHEFAFVGPPRLGDCDGTSWPPETVRQLLGEAGLVESAPLAAPVISAEALGRNAAGDAPSGSDDSGQALRRSPAALRWTLAALVAVLGLTVSAAQRSRRRHRSDQAPCDDAEGTKG